MLQDSFLLYWKSPKRKKLLGVINLEDVSDVSAADSNATLNPCVCACACVCMCIPVRDKMCWYLVLLLLFFFFCYVIRLSVWCDRPCVLSACLHACMMHVFVCLYVCR